MYAYDGKSKRVGKSNPTSATTFVYDALGQLAMEVSSVATVPECVTCYLSDDQLGSTRLVTDGSGNVVARHDYLPFGYEIQASDNAGRGIQFGGYDNINQKFTGKERDVESGLDYFGARYYGSALGRFTSPDPSPAGISMQDPQSWNLYSYVRNKPLATVDGNGNWATPIHGDIVTYALQGYVSAGDLAVLRDRQWVMDSDQKDEHEYLHFMNQGSSVSWQFVADMLSIASANTDANGKLSTTGLYALGDALHTAQDYTSPEHTDENFEPRQYPGGNLAALEVDRDDRSCVRRE
jgi:RHS repeat-associated protein